MTDCPDLFPDLVARFVDVDDLYVMERLLAAGYGMLIRHPDPGYAKSFATSVIQHIFRRAIVPRNLLLRDYAAGIVEFAEHLCGIDPALDTSNTRPPYKSPPPKLNASKVDVERIAKRAGGDAILYSCTSGDFYRDEIQHRIGDFTTVPLSKMLTASPRQRAFQFEERLKLQDDDAKWLALKEVRRIFWELQAPIFLLLNVPTTTPQPPPKRAKIDARDLEIAEARFLAKLSASEIAEYRSYWRPGHESSAESANYPRVPVGAAALWIAKRAYGLGWTFARFGKDIGRENYGSDRPSVESIGKEYQWLARSELLCRLADSVWLFADFDDCGPRRYRYATDVSFVRDVDPSLYAHPKHSQGKSFGTERRLALIPGSIAAREGSARMEWPFEGDPGAAASESTVVTDNEGARWLRLDWYASVDRRNEPRRANGGHDLLQQEFYFIRTVLCPPTQVAELQASLRAEGHIDIHRWAPPEHTDGPFLYENWRGIWPIDRWCSRTANKRSYRVAFPVEDYRWESRS